MAAQENTSDQHRPSPQRNIAGVMLGTRSRQTVRGDGEVESHETRPAQAVPAPVPRVPPGSRPRTGCGRSARGLMGAACD